MGPEVVRTRVSFDTNATYPKLQFGFGGFLDEETMEAVAPLFNSAKVKEITGEATVSIPAAIPMAKETPKPMLVKAKEPEVIEVVDASDDTSEIKPIRGFGATKVKAAAQEPAKPKVVPKVAPAKTETATDIADEIANLLGEMDADDA
jgi:type IV pilus biogenesis protein CpaD/CtpE